MYYVAAPYVANITLPSREEPELDLDEESSFSSDTSDSDTGSLVSEQSADPLTSTYAIENCDSDEEERDDDGDSDFSDDNDSSNGFQESDDGALFIEGPWQGLDMSAEQQLQSLQSGKNKASIKIFHVFSTIILFLEEFGSISRIFVMLRRTFEGSGIFF